MKVFIYYRRRFHSETSRIAELEGRLDIVDNAVSTLTGRTAELDARVVELNALVATLQERTSLVEGRCADEGLNPVTGANDNGEIVTRAQTALSFLHAD